MERNSAEGWLWFVRGFPQIQGGHRFCFQAAFALNRGELFVPQPELARAGDDFIASRWGSVFSFADKIFRGAQ